MAETLYDPASERAVLAGILYYGEDAYVDVADIIVPATFVDLTNQAIYKCVQHLYEERELKQFDKASLLSAIYELKYNNILEKPDNLTHIRSLFNLSIGKDNIRTWAAQLRKLHVARDMRDKLGCVSEEIEQITGTESIEYILGLAENAIFDFTASLQSEDGLNPERLGNKVDEYLDIIESHPSEIVGISSGMSYYDQSIGGGFRRKTISLIGARAKVGKSMLALNILSHVAKKIQIPVLYLDTEMSNEDQLSRLLPNLLLDKNIKITINDIETGAYSYSEYSKSKVREAAEELKQLPIDYLNVSGKSSDEVLSIMRRWCERVVGYDENGNRKDCLIVYDYLKMMSGDGLNDSVKEYQVLGFMTTSLHNFAVKYDVPILTFVQLNRDGVDRENTDVISGSDRILWLVTNFSIYKIKNDEEIAEDGPENGNRKLVPISARHGEGLSPGDYINIIFDGKYGSIHEGETKYNLQKIRNSNATTNNKDNDEEFESNNISTKDINEEINEEINEQ